LRAYYFVATKCYGYFIKGRVFALNETSSRKTPLELVKGRQRNYFEHFWNDFAADPAKGLQVTS
jgi:hypothetical protein